MLDQAVSAQRITSARGTVIAAEVAVKNMYLLCIINDVIINFRSAVYQLLQIEQAEQTRI